MTTAIPPSPMRVPALDRSRLMLVRVLLVAATVVALALSGWGSTISWKVHRDLPPAAVGELVAVPGGTLRVEQVLPEEMNHNPGMPQGMMPDPVPEGFRRFSVHVTLHATDAAGLAYGSERLSLSGNGLDATPPHSGSHLSSGVAPAGSTVSGSVSFQIPEDATGLLLSAEGGAQQVAIDAPANPAHGH